MRKKLCRVAKNTTMKPQTGKSCSRSRSQPLVDMALVDLAPGRLKTGHAAILFHSHKQASSAQHQRPEIKRKITNIRRKGRFSSLKQRHHKRIRPRSFFYFSCLISSYYLTQLHATAPYLVCSLPCSLILPCSQFLPKANFRLS